MLLTLKEDEFVKLLIEGRDVVSAYTLAFPEDIIDLTEEEVKDSARKLAKTKRITKRKSELLQEARDSLRGDRLWAFDSSVNSLSYVIDKVVEEVEFIEQSKFEEIDYLQHLYDNETDPKKKNALYEKILKKAQWKHLTQAQLQSVIMATSELNKMHGYNEENINLNTPVIFLGEEELEEEYENKTDKVD